MLKRATAICVVLGFCVFLGSGRGLEKRQADGAAEGVVPAAPPPPVTSKLPSTPDQTLQQGPTAQQLPQPQSQLPASPLARSGGSEQAPLLPRGSEQAPLQSRGSEQAPLQPRGTEQAPLQSRGSEQAPLLPRGSEQAPLQSRGSEQAPLQPRGTEQAPLGPASPLARQSPQDPASPLDQSNVPVQDPLDLAQPDAGSSLLLAQPPPQIQPIRNQPILAPRRSFAPGFELRPLSSDPNQPRVQSFGNEGQPDAAIGEIGPAGAGAFAQENQNLAVIRPQGQQAEKGDQLQFQNFPLPPPALPQQPEKKGDPETQVRQRIQQASFRGQVNNAGREREALLARLNITGNQAAAKEFLKQLKNLSDYLDKIPFTNVDIISVLINLEIQLNVDNWIINEEVAGELANTFNIPRESKGNSIVLTAADVDEMHLAGNNPTAAKVFVVKLKELIWQKIDKQYRITTDLLASFSDALLELLVGNGILKEKFAEDIATYFYRANNRKIKLF